MSDVDGLYTSNPKKNKETKLIKTVKAIDKNIETKLFENYDVLFCHQDFLNSNSSMEIFKRSNKIKILA